MRLPPVIKNELLEIKLNLERSYGINAPTMQDLISVACKKLIQDYRNPNLKEELVKELLKSRVKARGRMGSKKL